LKKFSVLPEMQKKRGFRDFLYTLSPWVLSAACILLFFVLTLFTVNNFRREKQLIQEALTQRGITVMRFIASYARERIRDSLRNGEPLNSWEVYMKSALQQAVEQPGIAGVVLIDKENRIITGEGEGTFFPGGKVEGVTEKFLRKLQKSQGGLVVSENLEDRDSGKKYFQVAAQIRPLGFAGRFSGMTGAGGHRMTGMHHRPFSRLKNEVDQLFSKKPALLIRLEPEAFSSPLRSQIIQMVILLVVFILVAFGGVLSLLTLKGLKDSQEELRRSERLAALGRMAAGVAHELRNPLSSIKGLAMLMKSGREKNRTALDETADLLVGEVDRLNRGIEELLDYAKPDQLKVSDVDVNTMVEKTSSLLTADLDAGNIGLELQLDPAVPSISADEDKLNRLLLNLLLNGVQAMENGGRLTISTSCTGKEIIIQVVDTGTGIAPADLKKIFDPYFTTKNTGTGLGLAICSKIVEEHGGEITLSSVVGKGTTAEVKIPI
jgi:two-component system sensor histidine kinase HydH